MGSSAVKYPSASSDIRSQMSCVWKSTAGSRESRPAFPTSHTIDLRQNGAELNNREDDRGGKKRRREQGCSGTGDDAVDMSKSCKYDDAVVVRFQPGSQKNQYDTDVTGTLKIKATARTSRCDCPVC